IITVILQMRLYALYHGSKRLLVFMVTFFVAEVGIMLWIVTSTNLSSDGSSLASIKIFIVSGSDLCRRNVSPIWIPPFAFEAILALLAVWAGIKHSRQESRSQPVRFNKSQLVGSLIHGNVIYFVG
ncbi:hypothetical protein SCLCIDRAFT_85946, partial [Scleroderma citrinum Foug A]